MSKAQQELKNHLLELKLGQPAMALGLVAEAGAGKTFVMNTVLSEVACRSVKVFATTDHSRLLTALPDVTNLPAWVQDAIQTANGLSEETWIDIITAHLEQLTPFILVIEDFHEANPQQQDFWSQLLARVSRVDALAMVFTSRTPLPAAVQVFRLEPLAKSDLKALLEHEAGTFIPAEALGWIESRTRGNPLFSLEYFRYLARSGFLWSDGQRWRWREPNTASLPARVEALIEQSLLPAFSVPLRSQVLFSAALLGSSFSLETLATINELSLAQVQEISLELERFGIFNHHQFVHPLYREVVLHHPSLTNREESVRQTLPYLMEHDPIRASEILGWAKLDTAEQLAYFNSAIVQAFDQKDLFLAARLRQKSIELLDPQARVPALLEAANWLRPYQLSQTLELLQTANQIQAHNPEVLRLMLEVLALLGRAKEGLDLLRALPETLQTNTWLEEKVLLLQDHFDFQGLLELWQSKSQHPTTPVMACAVVMALLHVQNDGAAQEVLEHFNNQMLKPLEHAQLLYAKACISQAQGQFAESIQVCHQLIENLQALQPQEPRALEWLEKTHQLRAISYSSLGNPRAAIADLEQCVIWLVQLGHEVVLARRQSELALCCLQAGDADQAASLLLSARTVLESNQQPVHLYFLNRVSAHCLLHLEDQKALQRARIALRQAQQTSDSNLIIGATQTLALIEASLGSAPKALDYASELETIKDSTNSNILLIRALALERLGQAKNAILLLEQAIQTPQRQYFEIPPEQIRLELFRMTKDHQAALKLRHEFKDTSQGQLLALLEKYFPKLEPQQLTKPPPAPLEVLGEFRWHGTALGERGRKALELLAYLLEARVQQHPVVSSEELFKVLYPNHSSNQANAALKQMVYRMRGYLGAQAIVRQNNGYALGDFESDLEQFLAEPRPELWRGTYLADLGTDHPSSIRARLNKTLYQLTSEMMRHQHPDTVRLARILLEMNPTETSSLFLVLQAAQQANDTVGAIHAYAQAKSKLEELGETLPNSWQEFLSERQNTVQNHHDSSAKKPSQDSGNTSPTSRNN